MQCPVCKLVEMKRIYQNGKVLVFLCPKCNGTKTIHEDELKKMTSN